MSNVAECPHYISGKYPEILCDKRVHLPKKLPAADPPAAAGPSPLPGAPGTFRRATRAVPSSRLSGTDLRDTLRWESATLALATFGKISKNVYPMFHKYIQILEVYNVMNL